MITSTKNYTKKKDRQNPWANGKSTAIHSKSHKEVYTYTLLYIKYITNKDLLYSTGNSTQYSVVAYMGKESKKEWIYVYV